MKNAVISLVLTMAITALCSFTNANPITATDEWLQDDVLVADTVPAAKTKKIKKNDKTPYDSFGKPKKMDSAR